MVKEYTVRDSSSVIFTFVSLPNGGQLLNKRIYSQGNFFPFEIGPTLKVLYCPQKHETHHKSCFVFVKMAEKHIQLTFSGSNMDGSFTMAILNSVRSLLEKNPTAADLG